MNEMNQLKNISSTKNSEIEINTQSCSGNSLLELNQTETVGSSQNNKNENSSDQKFKNLAKINKSPTKSRPKTLLNNTNNNHHHHQNFQSNSNNFTPSSTFSEGDESPLDLNINMSNSIQNSDNNQMQSNQEQCDCKLLKFLKKSKFIKYLIEKLKNRRRKRPTGRFGWFGFEPDCLQIFLTPLGILSSICFFVFFQSMALAGYFPAVLSTIEKRYGLFTAQAGLIISAYDIGSLCVVIFISYYGGSRHRLQWIAIGAFLVGLGLLTFTLPQYYSSPYNPDGINNLNFDNLKLENNKMVEKLTKINSIQERHLPTGDLTHISTMTVKDLYGGIQNEICIHNNQTSKITIDPTKAPLEFSRDSQAINNSKDDFCDNNNILNMLDITKNGAKWFILFFIVNFLNGISCTPIFTLGTSFLFEEMPSARAPLYVGILYLTGAIGPALGYLVCGFLLRINVDPWIPTDLKPSDPNYVGAWWLGFLIFGIIVLISSIPLFGFPRYIKKRPQDYKPEKKIGQGPPSSSRRARNLENDSRDTISDVNSETILLQHNSSTSSLGGDGNQDQNESGKKEPDTQSVDAQSTMSFGPSIRSIPSTIWDLVKNKVFLFITLSASCEFTIITAFMTYIPKYLEAQFSIAASKAALLCGSVLVPSAGVGIILGSIVVKKWELSRTGCIKYACFMMLIAICLFIPMLFVTCDPLSIAGLNIPYPTDDPAYDLSNHQLEKFNLMKLRNNPAGSHVNNTCNANCECDRPAEFNPICWKEEGVTFFNPCFAGCVKAEKMNETSRMHLDHFEFSECSCMVDQDVKVVGWIKKKKISFFRKCFDCKNPNPNPFPPDSPKAPAIETAP